MYQTENGSYTGFAYELLEEIAIHNNWTYEYIHCNYAEILEKLESGEIDVFIPYQKTSEREKDFEYTKNIFCTNKASLLTSLSSSIYYNDFEHLNGKKIGTAKNTNNYPRLKKLLEEKNCKATILPLYQNQAKLKEALAAGEIDAFVSASSRGIENCKIIYKFDETFSYALAKKGNRKLLDEMDKAIDNINLCMPYTIDILNRKYAIPEDGAYPPLSRKEADYAANKKNVTVILSTEECNEKTSLQEVQKFFLTNYQN